MEQFVGRAYRILTDAEAERIIEENAPDILNNLPERLRRQVIKTTKNYLQSHGEQAVKNLTKYIKTQIQETTNDIQDYATYQRARSNAQEYPFQNYFEPDVIEHRINAQTGPERPQQPISTNEPNETPTLTTFLQEQENQINRYRNKQSLSNLPATTQMSQPSKAQKTQDGQTATEQPMAESRAMSTTFQSNLSRETPISIPPTITYGLQDTHTTVLPCVFWVGMWNLHRNNPNTMAIRLNSPYQVLSQGTVYTTDTKPVVGQLFPYKTTDDTRDPTVALTALQLRHFPVQTSGAIIPWWRDYFDKLYNYYTVLNCEYEIIYYNPRSYQSHCLVAHSIETSSNANARKLPSNTTLFQAYGMKNINYTPVWANYNSSMRDVNVSTATIYGNYKPGSKKHDVANDGDIQLWTATDSTPTYKEELQLLHYQHPLSAGALQDNSQAASGHNINVQVRLKYTVQFKQLKEGAIYPQTQTPFALNIPTDAIQTV